MSHMRFWRSSVGSARCVAAVPVLLLVLLIPGVLYAGQAPDVNPTDAAAAAWPYDEPPPPDGPDVIRRSADGSMATIRATRIRSPLRIDGQLDEEVYREVRFLSDFTQTVPDNGQPATQRTEAWVLFDDEHFYVSARCYDTRPESAWTANEMRRDTGASNDDFRFGIDTYFDRRNGYQFYTNPLGRRTEQQITNEGDVNRDYNPVWEVRTGRFEGGWTVEMAIPFRSLRYRPGASQLWGMQIGRTIRDRSESSWLTHLPISVGSQGNLRQSMFPILVGLEAPSGSKNLEIKPFVTAGLATDRLATPPRSNDALGDVGFDVKYGVTQNLTVDVTVNTDLAQVEADDQVVNLTRFGISLPEKREFFLEGRNLFNFGGVGGGVGGDGGGGGAPNIFFSRRIGIQNGREVPILAGVRLTGKVGRTSIGALNVLTGEEEVSGARETNFTVLRLRQDILRRSNVGVLITNRSSSLAQPGARSGTYGIDWTFAFYENVEVDASYAKADTPGVAGPNDTYGGRFDYTHDRYGFGIRHLYIADNFSPEVGFVRRDDLRETSGSVRFSPRPVSVPHVEQFSLTGDISYTADTDGVLATREVEAQFETTFENTQAFDVGYDHTHDVLRRPFEIAQGIVIPAGPYTFGTLSGSYSLAQSGAVSGSFSVSHGGFFGGDDTSIGYSGRLVLSPQLALDPNVSFRWTDLPGGSFTTQQYRARVTYTFSPLMFFSGLIQYNTNSDTVSTSLRLRWEYSPGSEIFLAYTEEDDTRPTTGSGVALRNRSVAFKINRLFRF